MAMNNKNGAGTCSWRQEGW